MDWNKYYDKDTFTLVISCDFNDKLINLPLDVKVIVFNQISYDYEGGFNQPLDYLPSSLIHLRLGFYFDQYVDNLPSNLINLTFGFSFNKQVDNLPSSLTHLTFGERFNESVDKLPSKLTHLTFGTQFQQNVDKLPPNLTHLTFDLWFNQNINKFPINLKYVAFGSRYRYFMNIPEQVHNIGIKFGYDHENQIIDNLPSHIKQIKIDRTDKLHFIQKIPFGCKVTYIYDKDILL